MKNELEEIKKMLMQSKKSKSNNLLYIGLGMALVATIAGVVWFVFFKDKAQDDFDDEDWDDDDFDDYDFDDEDCDCEDETI